MKKCIKVFSYDFNSISDFTKILGYARPLALKRILQDYGSLEAFTKFKLKEDDDRLASDKLGRLIAKHNGIEIKHANDMVANVDQVLKAVKNLALNRFIFSESVDRDIDSILKMYDDPRSADEIKRALLSDI